MRAWKAVSRAMATSANLYASARESVAVNAGADFPVEFENETENTMRRRMLRPEVDGEIADCFRHWNSDAERMTSGEWRIANSE